MASRIEAAFKRLKKDGRKAFIPYVMAGDPSLERTEELVLLLERCGADVVELGVPFTDPLADGPVIQAAAQRAIAAGVTLRGVLAFVRGLREKTRVPIVLMTYYNPVFKYGVEAFCRDASEAGVDGLIVPDLPPEEAGELVGPARAHGVDTIFLLAPTSTPDRIKAVAKASRGFIYYVSITGITGAELRLDPAAREAIEAVRRAARRPVAVGFGVSRPEEARAVAEMADGVIVGSAIVKRAALGDAALEDFLKSLRKAVG
ncbi:MAG: tryptophan synthase subunit alpha [Thermodesulfovibrionales bacterium]